MLQLECILQVQLLLDPRTIGVDGGNAEFQRFRNDSRGLPAPDQFQHRYFAVGQAVYGARFDVLDGAGDEFLQDAGNHFLRKIDLAR